MSSTRSSFHTSPKTNHSQQRNARQSAAPKNVVSRTQSTMKIIQVIDPVFRAGKLDIPVEKTFATKGRDDWLNGVLRKDLSLCCLFQKGKCHAEDKCHQVHVDKEFMSALRSEQSKIISCCRHCHDTASSTPAALSFFAMHSSKQVKLLCTDSRGGANYIPLERLAYTPGLVEVAAEATGRELVLLGRRICRLHLKGACKYGKDCKNIHVCSKLGEGVLSSGFECPNFSISTSTVPSTVATPRPSDKPPKFSPASSERSTPIPMPAFSLPQSQIAFSTKTPDPVDVCDGSGRLGLSGITFDPTQALEDSLAVMYNPVYEAPKSPGEKRRLSIGSNASAGGCSASTAATASPPKTFALPLDHPSSQRYGAFTEAARVPLAEQANFLRFFAY